jgi:hypothetical protein
MDLAQKIKKKYPLATKKELTDILQRELHIKENHPTNNGWCAYCQKKTS